MYVISDPAVGKTLLEEGLVGGKVSHLFHTTVRFTVVQYE